jgi:hypothetical protein
MWASAGRDIITSIFGLDLLATYDVLCAGADGSVSAPLTLSTGTVTVVAVLCQDSVSVMPV